MIDLEAAVRRHDIRDDGKGRNRRFGPEITTPDMHEVFWLRGPRTWEPSKVGVKILMRGIEKFTGRKMDYCPRWFRCPAIIAYMERRAEWPVYDNRKALIKHIMRCAPRIACILCGKERAFFNRAENARKHRAKCTVAQSLGGDEAPETVYAWLVLKGKAELVTEPQLGQAKDNLGVQLCLLRDLIDQGHKRTMNVVTAEMVMLIVEGLV